MAKFWIQQSINPAKKGLLKSWATSHRLLTQRGTIDLRRAISYARKHGLSGRVKQINWAKNVRRSKRYDKPAREAARDIYGVYPKDFKSYYGMSYRQWMAKEKRDAETFKRKYG